MPPPEHYSDDAGVGAMASAYLRATPARRLVIEIDYVEGRAPARTSLDHLDAVLRRETHKPGGVSIVLDDEIPAERDRYSFDDIDALEREHRDRSSAGRTATIWIAVLNGDLAGEEGTLGVALTASAAVLFADRINGAATALIRPRAIERSVFTHEIGHLLGLVNIGYRSPHDHEDPDHPNHSKYRDSVMYWAIEDVSVATILGEGPPDDFDRFDRDDLALLRER